MYDYDPREIQEAREAGWQAKQALEKALENMRNASVWGVLDLLGGNLLSGMMKYHKLDHAQEYIEQAKLTIRKFQKELRDIHLPADMQININGFIRAADYLCDNVFVDIFVQSKIKKSIEKMEYVENQIDLILEELNRIEQIQN